MPKRKSDHVEKLPEFDGQFHDVCEIVKMIDMRILTDVRAGRMSVNSAEELMGSITQKLQTKHSEILSEHQNWLRIFECMKKTKSEQEVVKVEKSKAVGTCAQAGGVCF